MQTKVRGQKTPENAAGFAKYMEDWLHPKHVGKFIESRYIGCAGTTELQLAIATVAHGERKVQRGRKLKHSAIEFEGSTPYGITLTPDERRLIENAIVTKLDIVQCFVAWHIGKSANPKRRREDFHLLSPNQDSRGRPLTARQRGNLLRRFRSVMDQIHDEINRRRRREEDPHIPTMREVRHKHRGEGRAALVALLVESGADLMPLRIVEWLRDRGMLGKRYPKNNDEKAYVSVLYPPSGRARREAIKDLIADALLRRKAQRKVKIAEAKEKIIGLGTMQKESEIIFNALNDQSLTKPKTLDQVADKIGTHQIKRRGIR